MRGSKCTHLTTCSWKTDACFVNLTFLHAVWSEAQSAAGSSSWPLPGVRPNMQLEVRHRMLLVPRPGPWQEEGSKHGLAFFTSLRRSDVQNRHTAASITLLYAARSEARNAACSSSWPLAGGRFKTRPCILHLTLPWLGSKQTHLLPSSPSSMCGGSRPRPFQKEAGLAIKSQTSRHQSFRVALLACQSGASACCPPAAEIAFLSTSLAQVLRGRPRGLGPLGSRTAKVLG